MQIKVNTMKQVIHQLELSLLDSSVRQSPEKLSQLIADDFTEFGSSGKIYTKKDILQSLPFEEPKKFVVKNFDVTELSSDVMLATYTVTVGSDCSLRSSIWRCQGNTWQMVFHQGTKL